MSTIRCWKKEATDGKSTRTWVSKKKGTGQRSGSRERHVRNLKRSGRKVNK